MPLRAFRAAFAESRTATLTSLALLAIGIALRLHLYLDKRSLWLDEIWVALNVQGRSFVGLAHPLDYDQTAPVAFLWVERLAVLVGGVDELALRAFPFVAGCLFLVALWMLARRLIDVRAAPLCLAFAALSPLLIYYSNEVKPYASDSLAAAILIWVTLDVLDAPDSARAWRRLAVGGVLAILFSTPAAFVLAGVGTALVAHPAIGRTRLGWIRLVVTGALWIVVFALSYFAVYRGVATSNFMQQFWTDSFLSMPPRMLAYGSIEGARKLTTATFLGRSDGVPPRLFLALVMLASLVGAVAFVRRLGVSVVSLLIVPFLVTGAASLAHRWPLTSRLLVFLVPPLILLLGAGLWTVAGALPTSWRGAALAIMGALFVLPACRLDATRVRQPLRRNDVAPLVRDFLATRHGPVLMYVVGHAAPSWLFYSRLWQKRDGETFRLAAERGSPSAAFLQRACITQEPGLRVVYGGTAKPVFSDSALAGEAAWLAAQPERDVWLLTVDLEHESGNTFTRQLLAQGATKLEERAREGGELRHFRFPERSANPSTEFTLSEVEGLGMTAGHPERAKRVEGSAPPGR